MTHSLPLAESALAVLLRLPRIDPELVFPSRGGNNPVSGFSKWKRALDQASGTTNWRLHDIRRTAASGMAQLGVLVHVIEKVLNHKSGVISGVAAVYNQFGYLPEMKVALDSWASNIDRLTDAR